MIIALGLLSALLFTFFQVFQKKGLKKENVLDFLLLYYVMVFIVYLPIGFFVEFLTIREFGFIAILTFADTAGIYLFTIAMKNEDISVVAPLLNATPVFVLILAFFTLSELPTFLQMIGVFMVIVGGVIIRYKTKITKVHKKYLYMVLGTSFFWAINMVVLRYTLADRSPFTIQFWWVMMIALVMAFICRKRFSNLKTTFKRSSMDILPAVIFGTASVLVFLFALSQPEGLAGIMNPLRRTSTVFSVIIGGAFFKEKGILKKAIGCTFMLFGVFLIAV